MNLRRSFGALAAVLFLTAPLGAEPISSAAEAVEAWRTLAASEPGLYRAGERIFVSVEVPAASGARPQELKPKAMKAVGRMLWEEAVRSRPDALRPGDEELLHGAPRHLNVSGHVLEQKLLGDVYRYVVAVSREDFEKKGDALDPKAIVRAHLTDVTRHPSAYGGWFRALGAEELALLADLKRLRTPLYNVSVPPVSLAADAAKAETLRAARARLADEEAKLAVSPLFRTAIDCTDRPSAFREELKKAGVTPQNLRTRFAFGVVPLVDACRGFVRLEPGFELKAPEHPDPEADVEVRPAVFAAWKRLTAERRKAGDLSGARIAARMCFMTAKTSEEENDAFVTLLELDQESKEGRFSTVVSRLTDRSE